jgi:tRNA threonylcarbamoyl adenosine modification protein YeaZ
MSDPLSAKPSQRAIHLLGISCDSKGAEVCAARFEQDPAPELDRVDYLPRLFVASRQEGQTSSSDALLGMVDEVLGHLRKSAFPSLIGSPSAWLDGIVFNAGPGGFTAVRGACAVAQGLGFGWGKRIAAVSSLEAWAETVAFEGARDLLVGQREEVLVLLDARMGELYAGHFEFETTPQGGFVMNLIAESVLAPTLIQAWLASNRGRHRGRSALRQTTSNAATVAWYCGDFRASYPDLVVELEAQHWRAPAFLDPEQTLLRADGLLRSALRQGKQGFVQASQVGPHYVRNKVALNSLEQQALRDQHRAEALVLNRG